MTDATIHHQITELVEREHQLRAVLAAGGSDDDRAALRHVEESLDQCWDLLRQRDARRGVGADPDEVLPLVRPGHVEDVPGRRRERGHGGQPCRQATTGLISSAESAP